MNHGMKISKRCLALLMAVILVASNFSGLTPTVRAAEDHSVTVSEGQIVADNYALTDAEKELLASGLLVGGEVTYTAPTDSNLIALDTDNKTITVATYKDDQGNMWIPTAAYIYVGQLQAEEIALVNGEGTYTYAENAFSVKVTYTLNVTVSEETQEQLLGAAEALKQGVANLDDIAALESQLSVLELAMPSLVDIAENGYTVFGQTANITDESVLAAIEEFDAQIDANDGCLNLSQMITAYKGGSKIGYLVNNGKAMQSEAESTLTHITALQRFTNDLNSLIGMGFVTDQSLVTLVNTLSASVDTLVTKLTAVSADSWYVANNSEAVVATGLTDAQFLTLDALMEEISDTTEISTIVNPLVVATSEVTLNMSMYDVTVKVVLETVKNNEIVTTSTKSIVLTLAEGASAADVLAAVEASGIEAAAVAEWSAYALEHFDVSTSELAAELMADTTYIITYSPKVYTVSYDYADSQQLPYGYELVLPRHEDPSQAYDYTVNGVKYAQGATYTVVGNTEISRKVGKAYSSYDLYSIIADNYGDATLSEMVNSGALNGNVVVNVREPDPSDAESLVTLVNGYLTAVPTYASDFEGLFWVPYTYGENGNENLFNGNYTVEWSGKSVKVQYILIMDCYSADYVDSIIDSIAALREESKDQLTTLNRLASYYDTMGQLDRTKLGALNGVIGVTDFTPGDDTDTDAENLQMREYFAEMVGGIIANNLDSNNYLKIYNMLGAYKDENSGGLAYYYANYEAVIAEIASLSAYLNGMLADEEKQDALMIMVTAAGYPEYADKIQNLASVMEEVEAALTAPNALIDLESENLYKLINALNAEGEIADKTAQVPYLLSNALTALDESTSIVQVTVTIGNVTKTFTTRELNPGETLTQADMESLIALIEDYAAEQLGSKIAYYEVTGLDELNALVGQVMNAGRTDMAVAYTAVEYSIVIDGMDISFTVDINNTTITLPAHQTAGYVYVYTVFNREVVVGQEAVTINLTTDEIASIENGTYTVVWYDYNKSEADQLGKLDALVAALKAALGEENVSLVDGVLTVDLEGAQLMDFVMTLITDGGYGYYGLNNEGLIYMDEQNTLQLSIQTLINAVFSDEEFTRDNLIAMGKNDGGKLFSASLQLGDSATVLDYADMTLVVNLSSVPSQMKTALNALNNIKNYLNFYANDGVLEVELNLPDQVYAAYLTALVATGNLDKTDVNAIDQQIALAFMCDYLDAIISSGADMTTLENTLAMLGRDLTLEQYNSYYKLFADSLYYEVLEADGGMNLGLSMAGKTTIEELLAVMGMGDSFQSYLGMVAEYKNNSPITIATHVVLENADNSYCALILDAQASGISNKIACIRTDSVAALQNKLSSLAGYSVVILLSDVEGDLNISGTTLLDLNGMNVNGTINGSGNLVIIDSTMDTYNAGTVGGVSGNVIVIAGNYLDGVNESYLMDGYYVDGTTVRNAVYYIESDADGNTTFVINTDFYKDENINGYIPDVRALALDMVIDLVLNYSTTAGLFMEDNTIYDINFEDLLGLLAERSGEKVIDMLLATVDAEGISNVANMMIADLLDFEAIYDALRTGDVLATYEGYVAPWMVEVERIEDGDYLTMSIKSNKELQKAFSVSLKLEGESAQYLMDLAYELAGIVDTEEPNKTEITVNVQQPEYNNKELNLAAGGNVFISLDMSNNSDYAKMLAVILAYGNADKVEAVQAAFAAETENELMVLLKDIVDNTTVAELFTALKAMNRSTSFAQMAAQVGVAVEDSTGELEDVYHLLLVAAGKVLEELDITGMNTKLGNLYNAATEYYVLDKSDIYRNGEVTVRGYSALYDLSVGDLVFQVKLFAEHTCEFGEWIVTTPATCTTDGEMTRVCACGACETQVIPALGHSFTNYVSCNDATCTENGNEIAYCDHEGCTAYDIREAADSALGHSFTNYVSNGDATCTENGTETAVCDHGCGETDTREEENSALGHSFTNYVSNGDATCTENGTETAVCDHGCGETDTREEENSALGHSFTNYVSNGDATCTENGTETAVCDHGCGETDTRTEEGSAKGHAMGEWVEYLPECQCETDGERRRDCENCDHYEVEVIPARGHIWLDGVCQCCGIEQGPAETGDLLIGGLVALMLATVGGCTALVIKRKKENGEAEA